jgi:NAD(P)-dependent dehydrogenase (short-subunit alcohol dehydrogenase family)
VYGTSRREAVDAPPWTMLRMDVHDGDSVRACVERIVAEQDRIDVVVNNAGIGICGSVEDTSIEEARLQLETNFFGAVRVIRAVLPHMRERRSGRIINVGSIGGLIGLPFQGLYSASKFALEGLTEALRLELAPWGIQVTNVDPGDFRTEMTAKRIMVERSAESGYRDQLRRTLSVYERDETGGADPVLVARLVERLIRAPSLRPRYLVGKRAQLVAAHLKRLVGSTLFERLIRRHCRIVP